VSPLTLHLNLFSLLTASGPRCARHVFYCNIKPMPNPEIAITVHTAPESPPEDFELVHYPTHSTTDWKPSHRHEELPYYMTDDTSARRRVTHHPQAPATPQHKTQWVDEYDAEGKDVYSKANAFPRYGGGGRIPRRGPPPPPTSFVRAILHLLFSPSLLLSPSPISTPVPHSIPPPTFSASSSSKTWNMSRPSCTPSFPVGRGSTRLASHRT
jgi:hypothetical protein